MRSPRTTVVVALVALGLAAGCDRGSRDTTELNASADRFRAPATWTLLDRTDSKELCGEGSCVSAYRRWETADRPSGDTLRTLMAQAGWEGVTVNACEPRPHTTGSVPFCLANATDGELKVEVKVSGPLPSAPSPWWVILQVHR